jgi:hypothetical protein
VSAMTTCQARGGGCGAGDSDRSLLAINIHPVPGLDGLVAC